jgi:MFS transporter, CP family, cyanate transporter
MVSVAAVVLIGLNLRSSIASAGPLFHDLQDLLGYGPLIASLLPTIPVLCFAVAGAATAWLVRRSGLEPAIALALALLTGGLALRAVESTGMYTVTMTIGATAAAALAVPIAQRLGSPTMGLAAWALPAAAALAVFLPLAVRSRKTHVRAASPGIPTFPRGHC